MLDDDISWLLVFALAADKINEVFVVDVELVGWFELLAFAFGLDDDGTGEGPIFAFISWEPPFPAPTPPPPPP